VSRKLDIDLPPKEPVEWLRSTPSSVLFTSQPPEEVAMTIHHALPVLLALALPLASWPAHAQSSRRAEEPTSRAEPAAKAARPARVVASPGEQAVNINAADVKELMTLAGVGRKVAQRIVAYREAHGPFKKADEVKKVEGVSDAVWEKNRTRIAIR
jgi:competence protein ComEA